MVRGYGTSTVSVVIDRSVLQPASLTLIRQDTGKPGFFLRV